MRDIKNNKCINIAIDFNYGIGYNLFDQYYIGF